MFLSALILATLNVREFSASLYVIALVGVFVALSLTEVTSAPGRTYLFDGIGIYVFMAACTTASISNTKSPGNGDRRLRMPPLPSRTRAINTFPETSPGSAHRRRHRTRT